MTTAVTGATGYVGRFIVEKLVEEGVAVRALRRSSSDIRGLPAAIEWIDGLLDAPETHAALVEGADMLVHSALDHVPGRYRRGEGEDIARHLRVNVGGSLSLLATAKESGVRRCVVISSRAVFGAWPTSAPIADDTPPRPDTNYGAMKAALEAFVMNWGLAEKWPVTALRPTGVYGVVVPARKSKWLDIVESAFDGRPVLPRVGTEVHGRDVANAVWRLLHAEAGEVAGRMFNCSDIVVSTRDIVRLVHHYAKLAGPLPEDLPPPTNVMDCSGLKRLGVTFGGWQLLEDTVAELVAAVGARAA